MKKILTVLMIIIAAFCTASAFAACDLSAADNGGNGTSQDGGNTSGGNTSGGNTSGGNTSGGNTSGGNTSGGNTSGGNTSGGNTSGGNTSGGNTPHVCSYVLTSTVSADCLNQGYDVYSCTCGKTEKRNYKKALGHDYKDTIHKETCTTDWSMTSVCTRCKDTKTQTVADSKAPHDYEWTAVKPATCTQDGSKTGKCKACGATGTEVIKASGHSYGAYAPNNDATCTHDATQTAECAACGDKDVQIIPNTKLSHSFGAYISNNDGDCTHKGTKTATCSACGAKDTITDTASGGAHKWSYSYGGGDNCLSQSVTRKTCSVCGSSEVIYGDYGDHNISEGKCTLCGEILQKNTGKFVIEMSSSGGAAVDFGKVYLEFKVLSVGNYKMTYEMYVVQEYTVNGQKKTTRNRVVLPNPDDKNCGFYEFTLWSVNDNCNVTFKGWIDYDVHEADRWITFIIGGSGNAQGNSYSYGKRYYIAI